MSDISAATPHNLSERTDWHVSLLSLFPQMFPGVLGHSLPGKALENRIWSYDIFDPRDYAFNKHRNVDDTPFGGGAGMVMRADVLDETIKAAQQTDLNLKLPARPVIYMSPRGKRFDQAMAHRWAQGNGIIILCGRYEGVDQRVLDAHNVVEVSLGDFVLSGGEPAAMAMLDAVLRLRPGFMGQPDSLTEESFETGLLEYPHFTRPAIWQGRSVPDILQSGHHANIKAWRLAQAEQITKERRPDLWQHYQDYRQNLSEK